MHAPGTVYTVFYILLAVNVAGSLGWLIWKARREETPLPLAAFAGSLAIACVLPPIYNTLTLVWFPSNIPLPFVTAFGMKDPFFDFLGYALFIGFGGYFLCAQLQRGAGARVVWLTFAAWGLADLALEIPFLQLDLYTYYGHQPFLIGGFPLHWVFMNGLVPVLTGLLMYGAAERWPGGRGGAAWRVAACPAIAGALLFIPLAPVATALNADVPQGLRYAASLLSILISLAAMRAIARLVDRHVAARVSVPPAVAQRAAVAA